MNTLNFEDSRSKEKTRFVGPNTFSQRASADADAAIPRTASLKSDHLGSDVASTVSGIYVVHHEACQGPRLGTVTVPLR